MIKNAFYTFIIQPGVVLHELAHALIVILLPDTKLTAFNAREGYIKHDGIYTASREFLIGHAPLYINTIIICILYYIILNINIIPYYFTQLIVMILCFYGIIVAGLSSLPSFVDAKSPFIALWKQAFTIRFVFVILLGPFIIALSIPGLIVGYIKDKHIVAHIFLSLKYTIFIIYTFNFIYTTDISVSTSTVYFLSVEF